MKKIVLGIVLLGQIADGMEASDPFLERGNQALNQLVSIENIRTISVAGGSDDEFQELQDMIKKTVKESIEATLSARDFQTTLNVVSMQLKNVFREQMNMQSADFQADLARKEEEYRREREILEARLAEKEKNNELRGILLKINVNDRTPISERAVDVQQLTILERHNKTEAIYKRCLPFSELLGRMDLGVTATQEDLNAVHSYIENTVVKVPTAVLPENKPNVSITYEKFEAFGFGRSLVTSMSPAWADWLHQMGEHDFPSRHCMVKINYIVSSSGLLGGKNLVLDPKITDSINRATTTYNNRLNEYNRQQNLYKDQIKKAEAVNFPAEEFNRLVDNANRFFTEGLR